MKIIALLALTFPLLANQVLVFAGSTREESYNKKLASEASQIARDLGAKVTVIDLKDYPMPFFDEDLEEKEGMPKNAKRLRELMVGSDAIIISSPEYNGSIPAVLKNALDWASREEAGGASRSAFQGKRFAIMSASPGSRGGARGLVHLRSVIESIGGEVVEKEVTVPRAYEAFNDELSAEITSKIKEELKQIM